MKTLRPTHRPSSGFTLLEILLASVAAALLLAAVYAVFVQAIHLRDRAAARVRDSRLRERAEKILRDDLSNALVSGGVLAASLTGGSTSSGGPSGSGLPGYLKFTATTGKSSSGDVASDVQQIEYYLLPATGANAVSGQNSGVLTRAVTRDLLDSTTQTTAKEESILVGVQALQVQFYDGSSWQDSWQYTSPDSTSTESTASTSGSASTASTSSASAGNTITLGNSTLPVAVRVDVVLAPTVANGQPPPPIEVLVPWKTQSFIATPSPSPST